MSQSRSVAVLEGTALHILKRKYFGPTFNMGIQAPTRNTLYAKHKSNQVHVHTKLLRDTGMFIRPTTGVDDGPDKWGYHVNRVEVMSLRHTHDAGFCKESNNYTRCLSFELINIKFVALDIFLFLAWKLVQSMQDSSPNRLECSRRSLLCAHCRSFSIGILSYLHAEFFNHTFNTQLQVVQWLKSEKRVDTNWSMNLNYGKRLKHRKHQRHHYYILFEHLMNSRLFRV